MTPLEQVAAAVHGSGLHLRRSWPRDAGHLLLDLVPTGGGRAVAGQWFADDSRARRVAGATASAPGAAVRHIHGTGVVLQPGGADRRLPALAGLVAEPGAVLVAHRPERRAVVRTVAGDYTKVVRPERVAGVAAAAAAAGEHGLRVPRVVGVDPQRGLVTTAALPGRPLHDLLGDRRVPQAELLHAVRATGAALAQLHAAPVTAAAARHDAEAEAGVSRRWLQHAVSCGLLPEELTRAAGQALSRGRYLLGARPETCAVLHRDLHDKQVLVDADGVGFLDFDLAAVGEPALDLANVLVHLELRAHQRHVPAETARLCAQALLDAYAPSAPTRARLPGHDLLARARLVAVYAFRPAGAAAAAALLATVRS